MDPLIKSQLLYQLSYAPQTRSGLIANRAVDGETGDAALIGELVFWRRDFGHRQGRPVMPGRRFGLPA